MEIITAKNLDIGFNGVPVVRGIDFAAAEGEITVILGTSGSGKSTLLKTLVGLIPPLAGDIFFRGARVDTASEASSRALYERIGVLFQDGALLNSMSLYENVALPLRMSGRRFPEDIIRDMVLTRLDQFGLAQSAAKSPAELSGGMRKRGALARALILDPDVVFCDEPSAGLDPVTSTDLDALLIDLKTKLGKTLVVVTHELRSIDRIADRAVVLNEGRLHFQGSLADIQESPDPFIRTFFLRKDDRHD
jgi:phospholipid/cholesterol/gamma-HCH transport system ATP-binding protein